MVDQRLKELRGPGRRDFLRWTATVAAALGLERSRFLNVLGDTAGSAAADTSSGGKTRYMIAFEEGNGSLSGITQLFPFPKVIGSTNTMYSHYALGKGIPATGYDQPGYLHAPDSPWQTNSDWKISAFVAGANDTHTGTSTSAILMGANNMLAAAAAIQQATPTLLPVLAVGGMPLGMAPGAPAVAAVGAASQLVDLFNSSASRALLSVPESGALSESYYKAFLGLNAAAGRSTVSKGYDTGKVSMNLLAKNLASQLTPTPADQALLGITSTSPTAFQTMGNSAITALKAFSLGLSAMLIVPGLRDDPHGLFAGGDAMAMARTKNYQAMLNGIHDLAKLLPDPAASAKTLADNMVLTWNGDTFKNPFNRNGWGDGTDKGSNMLYVMGGGSLKTGFFGDMDPTTGAGGWDPVTGATTGAYMSGNASPSFGSAAAAVLFAVSKGDLRRVGDFYNGKAITGIVNTSLTGT